MNEAAGWEIDPGLRHPYDFRASIRRWLGRDEPALLPFAPIISEIQRIHGERDRVSELRVLELGPGRKTRLAELFHESHAPDRFHCVGLPRFRSDLPCYVFEDINEYLARCRSNSIDLVYSRFVLEKNCFHPLALLFSRGFGRLLLTGRSSRVGIPGTEPYLSDTMQALSKKLKPGGHVVAFVVDRRRSECVLEEERIGKFEVVTRKAIGSRMGLFTIRKKGKG